MAEDLRQHLVAYFEEHRKLVEAGALRLLLDSAQPLVTSREVIARAGGGSGFVTEAMVASVLDAPRGAGPGLRTPASAGTAVGADGFRPIVEGFGPTPAGAAPIEAYATLFLSRYRSLARLLRGRPSLPDLRPIRELRPGERGGSVIGMVREIRETSRRHHVIVTVDDETGSVDALVPRDSPGARAPFLPDEVVGLRLLYGRDPTKIPIAVGVERPDVPAERPRTRSSRGARVLCLSDLHVGSRSFLAESWARLVAFLHERGPRPDLARSIEYVVIAGDLVDGIGIYPRQEKDLAILDIVEQYVELGRRLAELPGRLTIVAVPGNHDAVCPAEPQPPLPAALAECLPGNVHLLANPSTFALDGVVVAAYHGRGFDDLIPALPGASYARPTEVMRRMLQMRHLGPIYGDRTPLAPLARDGLVLDPAPDLLVTGHLHTFGAERYRGTLMLNASTWQAETEYQRMRNIVPVPCRAAVVDLATLGLATFDFSTDAAAAAGPAA